MVDMKKRLNPRIYLESSRLFKAENYVCQTFSGGRPFENASFFSFDRQLSVGKLEGKLLLITPAVLTAATVLTTAFITTFASYRARTGTFTVRHLEMNLPGIEKKPRSRLISNP